MSGTRNNDVVKLPDIRLYIASVKAGEPVFNSMVPVLMDDGRSPHIIMSNGPVYRLSHSRRYGKLVIGELTDDEKEQAEELPGLFCGDPREDPTFKIIYDHMIRASRDIKAGPFNSPMWCRKARSRKHLTPRNNIAMREELKVSCTDVRKQVTELKAAWDAMAENAHCVGYCDNGMLWDADMIRSGGVVCVPKYYKQKLNIMGVCLRSDLQHIIKSQKWRRCII